MNVYQIGPVSELSRIMQRRVANVKLRFNGDWYIIAQLLEEFQVEQEIIIDKYGVGVPYKLKIRGILKEESSLTRANMNEIVLLIAKPLEFAKENHKLEIQEALKNANRMVSRVADETSNRTDTNTNTGNIVATTDNSNDSDNVSLLSRVVTAFSE